MPSHRAADNATATRPAVVATAAVALVAGLTWAVRAHARVTVLDLRVHTWLVTHRAGALNAVMEATTRLGSNVTLLPVLIAAAVILTRSRRTWRPLVAITVVYGTAVGAYTVMKHLVDRHRPPTADWLTGASGTAFPSGHATQATAAWGVLCILACAGRSARARGLLVGSASAIVLLVAASRVYLGVHWLTDVLAGISIGVAILALWRLVSTSVLRRARREEAHQTRGGTPN